MNFSKFFLAHTKKHGKIVCAEIYLTVPIPTPALDDYDRLDDIGIFLPIEHFSDEREEFFKKLDFDCSWPVAIEGTVWYKDETYSDICMEYRSTPKFIYKGAPTLLDEKNNKEINMDKIIAAIVTSSIKAYDKTKLFYKDRVKDLKNLKEEVQSNIFYSEYDKLKSGKLKQHTPLDFPEDNTKKSKGKK